jgi:penicillin-binding protein 1C
MSLRLDKKECCLSLALSLLLSWCLLIPLVLIHQTGGPYSYALYDSDGTLIGASVAADGQWRFSPGAVPDKFKKAVITFEDRRFSSHPGIDMLAIGRALTSNIRAHRVVSGGSTITMQTARILEHNKKRTLAQKIKEAFLAVLLEFRYTKQGILELYSANAPFGGNVIGLEAASWRYFNRPPDSLTWAEAATLAVLPNQPSLVYPGANKDILLAKRNKLLNKLFSERYFSQETLDLSLAESLPGKPYQLPELAPHYFAYLKKTAPASHKIHTTLNGALQKNTAAILERWSRQFSNLGINNAAALIINTQTGDILAYCGNTGMDGRNPSTSSVDLVQSRRSSGSLLKPFLYAAMLDSGLILPDQLVIDIPTRIGSYKPDNNVPVYRGAVPASEALSRSLNIPAVRELREYGISAFLDYLKECGFSTFTRSADDYGLPLILGGGELTLFEATKAYASMMNKACDGENDFPASAGASYLTLDALQKGIRPDDEVLWESFANAKKIAWKTGTSSGYRDAWAIGTTVEYTVGVWIGNAEGQGSPSLTSITTSAPVMFDLFSILPVTHWPNAPYEDLVMEKTCAASGYCAGPNCAHTKNVLRPSHAPAPKSCPYCKLISLTPDEKYQAAVSDMTGEYAGKMPLMKQYFVLPPAVEYWYTKRSLNYHKVPRRIPGHNSTDNGELAIVFPEQGASIVIPVEIDGAPGAMVMQAADRDANTTIYWDIDGQYLGSTTDIHELSATPSPGDHVLTVTDSHGNRRVRTFTILSDAD